MKLISSQRLALTALFVSSLIVFLFQACTPSENPSIQSSSTVVSSNLKEVFTTAEVTTGTQSGGGNGNGGGYEGKIDVFYAVDPEACNDEGYPEEVVVTEVRKSEKGFSLTREHCKDIPETEINQSEISHSELSPEILSLQGQILEKRGEKPSFSKAGDSYIHVMCRGRAKNDEGDQMAYADGFVRVIKSKNPLGYDLRGNFITKIPSIADIQKASLDQLDIRRYVVPMVQKIPAHSDVAVRYQSTEVLAGQEDLKAFAISLYKPGFEKVVYGQKRNGILMIPWRFHKDRQFYMPVWCDTQKRLPRRKSAESF